MVVNFTNSQEALVWTIRQHAKNRKIQQKNNP